MNVLDAERARPILLDVRPRAERLGEMGFIPGSMAMRIEPVDELRARLDALEGPVVLYCLSGRRSAELRDRMGDVLNLEGGILAWKAQGLSVCQEDGPRSSLELTSCSREFLARLRSCFLGQSIETLLDQDMEFDPLELFRRVLSEATSASHGALELERLVELASFHSWRLGTDLDHLVQNTNWARACLDLIGENTHITAPGM